MKKLPKKVIAVIIVLIIAVAGAVTWYFVNESQKSGFVKGAEKTEKWGKNVVKETQKVFK